MAEEFGSRWTGLWDCGWEGWAVGHNPSEVLGRRCGSGPKGYTSAPCPYSPPLALVGPCVPFWVCTVSTVLPLRVTSTTPVSLSQSEGR